MTPTSIGIPAMLTPSTLVTLLWWMIFIAGMYCVVGGAKEGNRREIETGLYCFFGCTLLYWLIVVVFPYLMKV